MEVPFSLRKTTPTWRAPTYWCHSKMTFFLFTFAIGCMSSYITSSGCQLHRDLASKLKLVLSYSMNSVNDLEHLVELEECNTSPSTSSTRGRACRSLSTHELTRRRTEWTDLYTLYVSNTVALRSWHSRTCLTLYVSRFSIVSLCFNFSCHESSRRSPSWARCQIAYYTSVPPGTCKTWTRARDAPYPSSRVKWSKQRCGPPRMSCSFSKFSQMLLWRVLAVSLVSVQVVDVRGGKDQRRRRPLRVDPRPRPDWQKEENNMGHNVLSLLLSLALSERPPGWRNAGAHHIWPQSTPRHPQKLRRLIEGNGV